MAMIYIAHKDATENTMRKIRELAEETMLRNPNWNGADIKVETDDHTWIDCSDEIAGAQLLSDVVDVIRGE